MYTALTAFYGSNVARGTLSTAAKSTHIDFVYAIVASVACAGQSADNRCIIWRRNTTAEDMKVQMYLIMNLQLKFEYIRLYMIQKLDDFVRACISNSR